MSSNIIELKIRASEKKSHINREIYGHFSEHLGHCIYDGIFVGKDSSIPNTDGIRNDIVELLRNIKIPVLRWPGGCFADEYHWKDGIGAPENRKRMINTHWGGVLEDNSFGTHEFMRLCELLECEPYITGNLGSGTVAEMSEWVEYMTFNGVSPMAELRKKNGREKPWKLKYFGVGNENWGCGGNMRPEYYADLYRRYATYCRNYGDNRLYKIACGPNAYDYTWTETVVKNIPGMLVNGFSLHYYTVPTGKWDKKGSASYFSDEEYYETIRRTWNMEELVTRHGDIIKKYNPDARLIVDEWGIWCDVEDGTNPGFLYQQNSMRDAVLAAINLNIFNNHSDIVAMANIAQTVNVLQSLILTKGEEILTTPTYHVFDMFKEHQDADLLSYSLCRDTENEKYPVVSCSVSRKDNSVLVTLSNSSLDDSFLIKTSIDQAVTSCEAQILTAKKPCDVNTFENKENVAPAVYDGVNISGSGTEAEITLPPCSVVSVALTL